jgi:hypothetical protein
MLLSIPPKRESFGVVMWIDTYDRYPVLLSEPLIDPELGLE